MIPRLKPQLGLAELFAALRLSGADDLTQFEAAFARLMGQAEAIAFPYGRTGLMLLLQAMGLRDRDIICPAYTCVVVPHAIVHSGNTPVFVDCASGDFNMDLEAAEASVSNRTGAVIATSIFGYPVNLDRIDAFKAKHPDIIVIQDCAHSFAAEWRGRPVQREGAAAVFGLNISKILCSVFGGMITTDDLAMAQRLRTLRNEKLTPPSLTKSARRLAYLLAVYPTFWDAIYGAVNRLERSGLLNRFTTYYDDTVIDMPVDHLEAMCKIEARVGLANISRYAEAIARRRAAASFYFDNLKTRPDFVLPPQVKGATYSHFVVRVSDRQKWLSLGLDRGAQLGQLIEYNIPEMQAYGAHPAEAFPVAAEYARSTINLPVWGGEPVARKTLHSLGQWDD